MSEIKPCPHCGGPVLFHQDATDCPLGCHYLWCAACKSLTDLSGAADPANECETLEELRAKIIPLWNRRPVAAEPEKCPRCKQLRHAYEVANRHLSIALEVVSKQLAEMSE